MLLEKYSYNMRCFMLLHLLAIIFVTNGQERIIGGDIAKDPIPYQVSLRLKKYDSNFCSGSIISKNIVLTAAHCVKYSAQSINPREIYVLAGSNNLKFGGVGYAVSDIVTHEGFDSYMRHDIALLKTLREILFNPVVHPIQLYLGEVPERSEMIVSGWGVKNTTSNEESQFLKTLTVQSIDLKSCNKMLHDAFIPRMVFRNDICTYNGPQQGVCIGDGGAPLVYQEQLVGITSSDAGVACGMGLPDIFLKVASYAEWIQFHSLQLP